jgi:hypothetical protein
MQALRKAMVTKPRRAKAVNLFLKEHSTDVSRELDGRPETASLSKQEKLNMRKAIAKEMMSEDYRDEAAQIKKLIEEGYNDAMEGYERSIASATVAEDVNAYVCGIFPHGM